MNLGDMIQEREKRICVCVYYICFWSLRVRALLVAVLLPLIKSYGAIAVDPNKIMSPAFICKSFQRKKAEGRKNKGGEFSITPDTLDVTFWHCSLLEKQ